MFTINTLSSLSAEVFATSTQSSFGATGSPHFVILAFPGYLHFYFIFQGCVLRGAFFKKKKKKKKKISQLSLYYQLTDRTLLNIVDRKMSIEIYYMSFEIMWMSQYWGNIFSCQKCFASLPKRTLFKNRKKMHPLPPPPPPTHTHPWKIK